MYFNTIAKFITEDGLTEAFLIILAGVMQGDTLAPYLFIIVIYYVMRQASCEAVNFGFTLYPRKVEEITDTLK